MKFLITGLIGLVVMVGVFFTLTMQNPMATVTIDIPGLGTVMGGYETTMWSNQTILQFRGIPYAQSPSGNRRFKAPVAKLPWRHIHDARNYGRRCPVITTISHMTADELQRTDVEDCLNLCVYTKNLTAHQPVMFYIYGGGFYNGSSLDHPPRHLLEKDIVLVVPQYRIGALGWLSTSTAGMPGNAPVMDLQLALRWVQDHIAAFGGDPDKVTIFGQSAGAAMSGALLLSPTTPENYFRRSIIQSGSILAAWAINQNPRSQVERICESLNCVDGCATLEAMDTCLRQVEVLKLLEVTTTESFAPVIGDLHGIIPEHPNQLFKQYKRQVPIMTGFTKHDGSFVLATYYDELKDAVGNISAITVRQFADGIIDMANDTTGLTKNLLRRLLFDADTLNSNNHKKALSGYFDLTNIQFVLSPMITFASKLVGKRLADTYLYTFDYAGEHTRFGYEFGNDHYPFNGGVHHSNDNIYLFSTHSLNADDASMAIRMVELWTSFAITGVPAVSEAGEPRIQPMTNENGPYFHINSEITLGVDVLNELTATIDDPASEQLNRKDIPF